MNVMRLLRSFVIAAIIVGFAGYAAARDDSAADLLSSEDAPVSPELKIVAEPDADVFTIRSVGAPVYNITVEAHAIVYLYGNDCMTNGLVSIRPIDCTYEPSVSRAPYEDDPLATSFSTRFGIDFEHVKAWYAQLRDAVGAVSGHCLTSVTMQHLIKVDFDLETGIRSSRYFLAAITYRDPIDSSAHHNVSHTSEIETDDLSPDQWREKMNRIRHAEHIHFRDVSAGNIDRARRYLTEMSGGPSPPAPPANLRIVPN
jgi:hypothetical protein